MGVSARVERPGPAASYRAGEARHRQGDLVGAFEHYEAALALDPMFGPALHLSAMALYQQGDLTAALSRIEAAADVLEGDAGVWSAYGVVLAALERPTDAAWAYGRGLALAPDDGVLWFNLGLVERDRGRLDEAVAAFTAAAKRLRTPEALHALGHAQQLAGRGDEAVESYQAALTLGAGAETALNAGAARHQAGDVAGAEAFYARALELDPACVKAMNNLAVIAQDAGDHDRAAELCRRAIVLDPAFADAHNNLGVALQRLADGQGALAAYRAALQIDPAHPNALVNLTETLFEQDRAADALDHCRAEAGARPSDPLAWLALARVLERGDDPAGAAEALGEAARLNDQLWEAPHRLGEMLQRLGEMAEAVDQHRRACTLAPGEPEVWRGLVQAAIKAGYGETALSGLSSLLRLDPFDPRAWAYQALALRLTGQVEAADAMTAEQDLVAVIPLTPPPGYASLEVFHQALLAELAAVRLRIWSPRGQSVVNGYQTQNDLFAEPAPAIQALRRRLDQAVAAYLADPGPRVRAFIPVPPALRRYRGWSVTLRAGGHHAPHIHPEGCLSGVYYVGTPSTSDLADLGGLEFGRPGFAAPLPAPPPTRVVPPTPGALVLFPSYLWHGTQGFTAPGERTTVAFDLLR